tara:strand:+ start:685 stop:1422 length:738 start_codon:yes stop_codon:yes gene_type:complete
MFTSESNKALVWGLLKEQSTIELTENWKGFFEKQIENINGNRHQYSNMIEMNKHLIAICMASLEEISEKNTRKYDTYPLYNQKGSNERYARDLKSKQEDLKKLQGGIKPPEINFTQQDSKVYGNLNQIMERQMANRQKELMEIGKNYSEDAKQWLNISEKSGAPKIKIGEEANIKNEIIETQKKKVKFKLGSDIYVKLKCIENGEKKEIILKLSDNFHLETVFQEDLNTSTNITLQNVEVFTKSG